MINLLLKYIKLIEYNYKFLIVILFVLSIIVYRDFLFAQEVYILKDIGADTLAAYLPQIIQFKEFFDDFSFYNFTLGLGDSTFSFGFTFVDIFNYFYLLIPNELIPTSIIYVMIIKHILAGLFFYLFLKRLGFTEFSSLVGTLLFVFSGYIFIWGHHYHFASNIVYISLLLYAFEKYIQENKYNLFLFALILNLFQIYFFFQASIFLLFYMFFRLYYLEYSYKKVLNIFGLLLLALLLVSAFLLPFIGVILDSPRVGGVYFSPEYFRFFHKSEYYFALFFRLFSTDIFGTGNSNLFTTYNYYEAPVVYSGLLVLTILPLAFKGLNKKLIVIFSLSFIVIFLSLFITFFIAFYNGFSIISHRYFFILNIIFILLTVRALEWLIKNEFDFKMLFVYLFLLSIISVVLFNLSPIKPYTKFLYIGYLFIAVYSILLYFKQKKLLVVFIVLEILVITHFSLKDRIFVKKDEIQTVRKDTKEAINYIRTIDSTPFYRIEKLYIEYSPHYDFNDGMYHNFFSTMQYSSILNKSFLEFHRFYNIPLVNERKTRYIKNSLNLLRFLGVKYLLSKDELFIPNYEKIHYNDNVFIYKNINKDINLGVVYDNFVDFDFISKYDKELRDEIIMQRAIVSNEDEKAFSDILKKNLDINFENIYYQISLLKNVEISEQKENSITYKALNNDPQIILTLKKEIEKSSKNYISFELDSPSASQGVIYFGRNNFSSDKKVVFQVDKGKKDYKVYINNDDFNSLRIDVGNQLETINIKNISVNSMKNIPLVTSKNLELKNFKQDNISFDYNGENSSIIVFNILYDIGWKIYVDDKERKSYKLNGAFIGIPIEKGNHNIQLVFLPKFFNLGIYLFILGIVICIIIIYIKLDIINTKNLKNTSKA